MFKVDQFRTLIKETLTRFDPALASDSAVNLLLGTAAQESHLGTALCQVNGPALGVFQMEPRTEVDIWENYLRYRRDRAADVLKLTGVGAPSRAHLRGNLLYQTVMARLHYRRVPWALPMHNDVKGMAAYWKKHYNTHEGRGTEKEFRENYSTLVG